MSQLDINHNSRPPSSSSLHHWNINDNNGDQRDSSSISQNAKRYATYELNWRDDHSDYISNDGISDININNINDVSNNSNSRNSMNSAQAARCSLPSPTIIPLSQEQLQHNDQIKSRYTRKSTPITINTKRRFSEPHDKNENEPQSPFGGITVTTVKVVEIHSPTEKHSSTKKDELKRSSNKQRDLRPVPLDLSANPVGIITSERNERKQRINMSPPPPPSSTSQLPPPLPRIDIKNIKNENKKLVNQDPNILKQKYRSSIINSQKIKRNKSKNGKNPEIIIPKEMSFIDPRLLAHNKSLVRVPSTNRNRKTVKRGGGSVHRKRMPPKNLELSSTSNPVYSNDPTDMEADLPPVRRQMFPWLPNSTKPPQLLHASLVPLPHRVNRIIGNETSDSNNNFLLASANQKRNSKTSLNRLSRTNSQRRRASIIVPNPNRASLIFRRQILEESLMMSFGGGMQPQQPVVVSKQPIRRRTKKGSNAKVEDRETRRERRRKEKLEKKLGKKAQNDNVNGQIEGTNIENENRIIEPKVESQKEIHMGPQPPPRKLPQDTTIGDHSPLQKRKNSNTSPLLSSPPERRLGNSNDNSTDEPPPFPAHLARSSFFEHSNKERSKRKQPPYSPLIVQPVSSISNYSSPSEGNGLVNEEVTHETSSQQLHSPKFQKTGGLLGFFNKQTSPPLSQISSPPTQLSLTPQSPTTSVPLTPSTPPQSPPSSPRSMRFRVGRSRHGVENGPSTPPAVQDQEKLRKMEQFEALIAKSETSSLKKPITEKIKAAITTAASSSSSREINLENEQTSGASSDIDSFKSLTDSVHYNPEEKPEFGMVDDDGMTLRVTLTPEVCR